MENNKLSIGMYVRTKEGIIGKYNIIKEFENVPTFNGFYETKETEREYVDDKPFRNYDIKKSSFNLIDLIEVGDYVNGWLVYEVQIIDNDEERTFVSVDECYDNYCGFIHNNEIKSIVTKEKFESMEYLVK
jgi:hypothetical protein